MRAQECPMRQERIQQNPKIKASSNEHTGCQSRCRQGVGGARNLVVMANDQSQEQKSRSSKRHRKKGGQIIFLHCWTCAIPKTRSWNICSRSTKDVVVLWGDIVKDDSSSYAALTKHDPSASQMTAAKVIGVIVRADAVIRLYPSQSVQTSGNVYNDKNCPSRGPTSEEPVVLLERNLYGHPVAVLLV